MVRSLVQHYVPVAGLLMLPTFVHLGLCQQTDDFYTGTTFSSEFVISDPRLPPQPWPRINASSSGFRNDSPGDKQHVNTPESGTVSFQSPVTYSTGGHNPYSVAIADVNGDGKPDLIVANHGDLQNTESSVAVLLGKGDGTFKPAVDYGSGGIIAYSVAVADVNGDGKPDVIVANGCLLSDCFGCAQNNCPTGGIGVLLGNGDGTFQPGLTFSTGHKAAFGASVAVADLNANGDIDVAVATMSGACCPSGSVSVLFGNGSGSFSSAVAYPTQGYGSLSVTIGDVNSDHRPDLLVANLCAQPCPFSLTEGSLAVLFGNGHGAFGAVVPFFDTRSYLSGGYGSIAATTADLNRDGKMDILIASCGPEGCGPGFTPGTVSVLLGNGDGTFQPANVYSGGTGPHAIVAADMNGDGELDAVVANWGTSNRRSNNGAVTVLLGKSGVLQSPQTFLSGGAESASVAVADLNGDGKPDIVLACVDDAMTGAQGVVSVLLNNTQ